MIRIAKCGDAAQENADEIGLRARAGLGEDAAQVAADRVRADADVAGDRARIAAAQQTADDGDLGRRQTVQLAECGGVDAVVIRIGDDDGDGVAANGMDAALERPDAVAAVDARDSGREPRRIERQRSRGGVRHHRPPAMADDDRDRQQVDGRQQRTARELSLSVVDDTPPARGRKGERDGRADFPDAILDRADGQ